MNISTAKTILNKKVKITTDLNTDIIEICYKENGKNIYKTVRIELKDLKYLAKKCITKS